MGTVDEKDPRRLWATVRFNKPLIDVTEGELESILNYLCDELRELFHEQVRISKRLIEKETV